MLSCKYATSSAGAPAARLAITLILFALVLAAPLVLFGLIELYFPGFSTAICPYLPHAIDASSAGGHVAIFRGDGPLTCQLAVAIAITLQSILSALITWIIGRRAMSGLIRPFFPEQLTRYDHDQPWKQQAETVHTAARYAIGYPQQLAQISTLATGAALIIALSKMQYDSSSVELWWSCLMATTIAPAFAMANLWQATLTNRSLSIYNPRIDFENDSQ